MRATATRAGAPAVRRVLALLVAASALVFGACGDDGGSERPAVTTSVSGADLRVTIRPAGRDGAARTRHVSCAHLGPEASSAVCRHLGGVTAKSLAPVPGNVACAELFGGPATASVSGKLRGEEIHATFALSDGCQIARWRRNTALLGKPPGNPPAPG